MAKFFNKIRKKLLSNNKTGRYLTYAAGEIILVVIGILLALQINNWNEGRKREILKNTYLTRLINDVKKDTSNINYIVSEIKKNQACIDLLISSLAINSSASDLDSTITSYFERGWIISEFIPTDNTYTDLSQTGNMNILKNTALIDEIIRYYGFVQVIENSNNVNKDWITPLDQELARITAAFELDPTTTHLFSHKSRVDAIKDMVDNKSLVERNAAGHYWINESLSGNVVALKGVCKNLIKSLNEELHKP